VPDTSPPRERHREWPSEGERHDERQTDAHPARGTGPEPPLQHKDRRETESERDCNTKTFRIERRPAPHRRREGRAGSEARRRQIASTNTNVPKASANSSATSRCGIAATRRHTAVDAIQNLRRPTAPRIPPDARTGGLPGWRAASSRRWAEKPIAMTVSVRPMANASGSFNHRESVMHPPSEHKLSAVKRTREESAIRPTTSQRIQASFPRRPTPLAFGTW
jgi:hypothetical protein